MAEPVRIGLDGCVLGHPVDRTQEYLAAIFDELRALRLEGLSAPAVGGETVEIRELATPAAIAAPSEAAAEALAEVGIDVPTDAPDEPASLLPPPDPDIDRVVDKAPPLLPKKPTARKRTAKKAAR